MQSGQLLPPGASLWHFFQPGVTLECWPPLGMARSFVIAGRHGTTLLYLIRIQLPSGPVRAVNWVVATRAVYGHVPVPEAGWVGGPPCARRMGPGGQDLNHYRQGYSDPCQWPALGRLGLGPNSTYFDLGTIGPRDSSTTGLLQRSGRGEPMALLSLTGTAHTRGGGWPDIPSRR